MVSSPATSVAAYLASLPAERRAVIEDTLPLVRRNLPPGYDEGMLYGMIAWYVPRARLAATYNGQPLCAVALAAQKHYTALYLMAVDRASLEQEFRAAFAAAGRKLDMGKSCLRFRSLDDLHLPVVPDAIAAMTMDDLVAGYHASRARLAAGKGKGKGKEESAPKTAAKKRVTKAVEKAVKRTAKTTVKKTVKKSAKKTAKTSVGKTAKKAPKASARKTTGRAR